MNYQFFDIEANGFLDDVSTVWVISFKNALTGEITTLRNPTEFELYDYLDNVDVLIGHNIIDYDLPVLEKIYDCYWNRNFIDTLVMSYLHNPDISGGHSLSAWGSRLGLSKGDWTEFSEYSEGMVEYCERDVELTGLVYEHLAELLGIGTPRSVSDGKASEAWSGIQHRAGSPTFRGIRQKNLIVI